MSLTMSEAQRNEDKLLIENLNAAIRIGQLKQENEKLKADNEDALQMLLNQSNTIEKCMQENQALRELVKEARDKFVEQEYPTDVEKAWLEKAKEFL